MPRAGQRAGIVRGGGGLATTHHLDSAEVQGALRELANLLELQPYQLVVVRRALTSYGQDEQLVDAEQAYQAEATRRELFLLLTPEQLTRLAHWVATGPAAARLTLLALTQ